MVAFFSYIFFPAKSMKKRRKKARSVYHFPSIFARNVDVTVDIVQRMCEK